MELLNDQHRKDRIVRQLQSLPKDIEVNEKKLKINNLEQELFLGFCFIIFVVKYFVEELDRFNKENTQKIVDDIHYFEEVKIFKINLKFFLEIAFFGKKS